MEDDGADDNRMEIGIEISDDLCKCLFLKALRAAYHFLVRFNLVNIEHKNLARVGEAVVEEYQHPKA